MSYLMRVRVPDSPGALGKIAQALGNVDGNIQGVDIVGYDEDDSLNNEIVVVDDIVVDLPHGTLPDVLITAAQEVEGVFVDSIRPFSGSIDRRGQVQMLASIAALRSRRAEALETLMADLPRSMSAGWAIVLDTAPRTHRIAASSAAPEDNGQELDSAPVCEARVLNPEQEDWIPEPWAVMDSSLAATPIEGSSLILIVGRPGGPDFLLSEVEHLRQLGCILGALFCADND
ncbi:amino acid-binding ACT domain protein [Corynebacterium sp.]|uniref:amino acid-binding ACT domain protein n=1 Tax=Corynebacterium sp. TaxID=1720 RepID=UPI0026312985|nr:amino acid-binding ACT domain protein [Corynebacterium sp.]